MRVLIRLMISASVLLCTAAVPVIQGCGGGGTDAAGGCCKVERRFMDNIRFDERLQAAKALIDECLTDWTEDGRDEIKVLIQDAFRVDQQGQVNTARVLGLRRHPFKDPRWTRAMEAIGDSLQVVGSSSYVRVYERVGQTDEYRQIALDLASA